MNGRSAAAKYVVLSVLGAFALHMLSSLLSLELDFDESFNLQVPLNLCLGGVYRTWYNGYHEFNYLITTGPAVLFPAYFAFMAGSSTSFILARIVTLAFSLLFIGVVFRAFFGKDAGRKGALYGAAALTLVFSVPEFVTLSVRVLGEVPGAAFIIAGYLLFTDERPSRSVLSGALLAFAVLSKLIYLMAVAPVVLVLILDTAKSGRYMWQLRRAGYFLYGFLLPLAFWQVYKLSSLGTDGYLQGLDMFARFFGSVTEGSSGPGLAERAIAVSGGRLVKLMADINLPEPAGYIFIGLLAAVAALAVYRAVRTDGPDRFHLMVFAYGLVHTGWWAMMDIVDYYRHLFPGVLFMVTGTALMLYGISRERSFAGTAAAGLFAVFFFLFGSFNLPVLVYGLTDGFSFAPSKRLRDQEAYAAKVSELAGKGYLFYGYEWLQCPELSFMARIRFFSAYDARSLTLLERRPGFIVVSDYSFEKNPELTMKTLTAYTDIGKAELEAAGFPGETPYVFAPITKIDGRRIVPVFGRAALGPEAGKGPEDGAAL